HSVNVEVMGEAGLHSTAAGLLHTSHTHTSLIHPHQPLIHQPQLSYTYTRTPCHTHTHTNTHARPHTHTHTPTPTHIQCLLHRASLGFHCLCLGRYTLPTLSPLILTFRVGAQE